MKDQAKTKKQLIDELEALRRQSDEPKQEEEKIQRVSQEWEDIFQAIGHPTIILDAEHNILSVNKATVKAAGAGSAEDLIGRTCYEIFHKAGEPPKGCPLVKMLSSGKPETTEMEVEAFGGVFLVSCTPVFDENGDLQKIIHIATDITERRRAEAKNTILSSVVEDSTEGMAIADLEGNLIFVNNAWCRMHGYKSPEELIGMSLAISHNQKQLENEVNLFNEKVMELGTYSGEVGHITRDGKPFQTLMTTTLLKDRQGKPYALAGIARDITERKQAEEALRESEQKYRTVVQNLTDAYYIHDFQGQILDCNENACRMLGYRREELIGENLSMIDSPENIRLLPDRMVRIMAEGKGEFDGEHIRKDGSIVQITISPSVISREGRGRMQSFVRDITERRRAEEALRASEAELHDQYFTQATINLILSESLKNIPLELILQKALNMILSIPWLSFEAIGSIHLAENSSGLLVMKAWYNLPKQLKKMCAHVAPGKCLCGRAALTQKIEFSDHIDGRHEICYEGMEPHGHYIVPILFGSRTLGVIDIYLKEGHIRDQKEEEFLLTVADTLAGIIVRRQSEDEKEKLHAQLLQAQKMEAVGQLAGGIAHDFNNILTAMIGYGHLLKMKLKDEDPLRSYADHILSLSDRAANLTQSLLAFSRKQIINSRPVDLNEIIKRIDHLLSRIIGEDIPLQTMLSEKDLIVMADPGQIEQVLMNLAANARDAMPEGGLFTIETETVVIDSAFIREHGFGKEGAYALISVTDTGAGMDRETREKIFEPFFTTKEVGKGTGLGLAMVYGIIKQHEGYVNVYSEPGSGTTFRMYLPLIEAKVEEVKHEEVVPPIVTGTETVLLAEDETELRVFTKKLLEEYGYKVITATTGQEAINEFKGYKNRIQLLLLDVIMPNKNGKEAYEEIRQIRPDIKVIFISGYPADIIHRHGILEKGFAYIEKPVSPVKLLKKIKEVLGK